MRVTREILIIFPAKLLGTYVYQTGQIVASRNACFYLLEIVFSPWLGAAFLSAAVIMLAHTHRQVSEKYETGNLQVS